MFLFVFRSCPHSARKYAEAEQGMAFLSSGGGLVNEQLVRSYQAEVARRAAAVRQKLSFLSPSDQDAPILTAGGSPPMVPPSDREVGGAAPSGAAAAALAGTGEFSAGATVVRPEPDTGRLIARGSLSRVETDYPNLLVLAISLEKMAREEITRLSSERPNDPDTAKRNRKQIDLLYILADGFAKIAGALEEYFKDPQPLLAGKAKEIVDWVGAQFKAWWEANAAEARDWCIRLPIITAAIGTLGSAGANMTVATTAVTALVGGPKVVAAIKTATKRTKRP